MNLLIGLIIIIIFYISYSHFNINKKLNKKVGVVITTHGNNGILVRQCIKSFIKFLPKNSYISLFVNESEDEVTLSLKNEFSNIDYYYIDDQKKNGGLTATWNQGIMKCFENNCEVIILSNDDILINDNISNIIDKSYNTNSMEYFGPLTNKNGVPEFNFLQHFHHHFNKDNNKKPNSYNKTIHSKINLNGFFMVFPKHVLIKNMIDKYYFNPKYPFGRNEVEWYNRFKEKGGKAIIDLNTVVYHYKLKTWKNLDETEGCPDCPQKPNTCIYTINIDNDFNNIKQYNNNNLDLLYFTDNFEDINKCIELNIIPMMIFNDNNDMTRLHNSLRSEPNLWIPSYYSNKIYVKNIN